MEIPNLNTKATSTKDLLLMMQAELASTSLEPVPADWMTTNQMAKEMGQPASTVSHFVTNAVRAGKMEVRRYRVKTHGRVGSIPHYRPIRKG
jgi:predicted transcriptional regulator